MKQVCTKCRLRPASAQSGNLWCKECYGAEVLDAFDFDERALKRDAAEKAASVREQSKKRF